MGTIPGFKKSSLNLQTNIFSIKADICEIKKSGKNDYQCLLLIGKNDIDQNDIVWPEHIKFVNYSSDYMVIRANKKGLKKYDLKRGTIEFSIKYYALARLLSSEYANVCLIK